VLTYLSARLASLRARLRDSRAYEAGVTAVEYAIMVAIVALLLVGGFYAFFQAVEGRYGEVGNCIASGPVPEVCNPEGEE
jgi:Flp pilus assembly pilin Flp